MTHDSGGGRVRLTKRQRTALGAVQRYSPEATVKWASASELCSTPAVMGSLVRRGFVRTVTQEERPLGQRTIRYGWYQITPAGREALRHD